MSSIAPLYGWPDGFEAAVIIGIDDIHPESSTEGFDCGGNIEGGALERIKLFMEKYPKVPITLYVTPDWRYRPVITSERFGRFRSVTTNFMNDPMNPLSYIPKIFNNTRSVERYRIDKEEFNSWRIKIKELIEKYPLTVGIHGLTHIGKWPPFYKEFLKLNYDECLERIRSAKQIFSKVFPVDGGFIPPSYGINLDLINALAYENFEYICIGANRRLPVKEEVLLDCPPFKVPANYPSFISKGIMNFPRNWNLGRSNINRAIDLIKIHGVISVYGHACHQYYGDWRIDDGIIPENLERLGKLIDKLEKNAVWFTSASEISRYFNN
jgi:hypothetical protein